MTIRAGFFGATVGGAATAVSASVQVDNSVGDKRFAFLVVSDVVIHLHRTEGGVSATAATTSDMRLPADTPYLVNAFAGDWLSWVKGATAVDGTVWLTRVDH